MSSEEKFLIFVVVCMTAVSTYMGYVVGTTRDDYDALLRQHQGVVLENHALKASEGACKRVIEGMDREDESLLSETLRNLALPSPLEPDDLGDEIIRSWEEFSQEWERYGKLVADPHA